MDRNTHITSAYGVEIPRILYGTAWKKERTATLVEQALDLGFRGIDTACQPKHYDEAGVGRGVAAGIAKGINRSELYLQSKFTALNGQDPQQIPYDAQASLSDQVIQSFQKSLNNLQTTYLDCLVLHAPMSKQSQMQEVWQAMEAIFSQGRAKQLGISNCYDLKQLERLYETATVKPAVLQNRFIAETQYDRKIRDFCQEEHIIYQSFWTLTANPHILSHKTIQTLVNKYRHSAEQLFFRYLSQIDIIPLSGTTSPTHMREDLAIFDFKLTIDECGEIGKLL